MWSRPCHAYLIASCLALVVACGPAGGEDNGAPAFLAVEPDVLEFGADEDTRTLLVKNTGGEGLSYAISVTAQSAGVVWLEVDPKEGVVEGGGARSILVRVINRDSLQPGTYTGQVTVEAESLDSVSVDVSMTIGQPILSVDPVDALDFGASSDTRSLIIKNTGQGSLLYSIILPGPWVTTVAVLQKEILPSEPQTVTLTLNRDLVPWYGEGLGELVVSSNGLEDATHSSTARIDLLVEVDPACKPEAGCTKEGYYCDAELSLCKEKKTLGNECASNIGCKGGLCEDGVCCQESCSGACNVCNAPGNEGSCAPAPEGTACEDGFFCTSGDSCQAGACSGGEETDCSQSNSDCSQGFCDAQADACAAQVPDGKCSIANECFAAGDSHAEVHCLKCLPDNSQAEWSIAADSCFIDGACYAVGEALEGECVVCDSAAPSEASTAPDDAPCDDADPCTETDLCQTGVCIGQAVDCDDQLECTADSCNPTSGECDHDLSEDWCLLDGTCHAADTTPEGKDALCLVCAPATATDQWTATNEELACDDLSVCSAESQCQAGECVAVGPLCDDGNECTEDLCSEELTCTNESTENGVACTPDEIDCTDDICVDGECAHPVSAGSCHIEDQCVDDGIANAMNLCEACSAAELSTNWSPANEDGQCDDGLFCTVDDACVAGKCTGAKRDCGSDQCNDDWCIEEEDKCVVLKKNDGLDCDDENACTLDDTCQEGLCTGPTKDCSAAAGDNPCLEGWCDPDTEPVPGECKVKSVSQGEPCEDGLACTTDSVCDGAGSCGEGTAVSANDCAAVLDKDDPCLEALCQEPDGCVLAPVEEGTECQLTHAFAQCLEGTCTVVLCNDDYDDCDEETPGCETWVSNDPSNCGECGEICELADAVDTCFEGSCVVISCNEGFGDCDKLPETGCEKELAADPENCGECKNVCTTADFSFVGVCEAGECATLPCPEGALDGDGQPGNGCEIQAVIWVDSLVGGGPDEDGSFAHPFDTIQEGVDTALTGYAVYVKSGVYDGGLVVDTEDLAIIGDGVNEVLVDSGADLTMTGITVTKSGVSISGVAVQGGKRGLHFLGTPAMPIVGGEVSDVVISGITSEPLKSGNYAIGILAEQCQNLDLHDFEVTDLTGTDMPYLGGACQARTGGRAAGLYLVGCTDCSISRVSISNLSGGHGEDLPQGGLCEHTNGPPGGDALGVLMRDSALCRVKECTFDSLTGGQGGAANTNTSGTGGLVAAVYLENSNSSEFTDNIIGEQGSIKGGQGGQSVPEKCQSGEIAAGFYLTDSTGNSFSDNQLADIDGGSGGECSYFWTTWGPKQAGFGLYLEPDSLDNLVETSNTLEDQPIVYLYEVDGAEVKGLDLSADVNPTNLGKLVAIGCSNLSIADNEVAGFRAQAGFSSTSTYGLADVGRVGAGIRLEGCSDCQVTGNTVHSIHGGQGGYAHAYNFGGTGGDAAGLLLQGCTGGAVTGNTVATVQGGTSGLGGQGGQAGGGAGVRLDSSTDVEIAHNIARFITGGIGDWMEGWIRGNAGAAQGFLVLSSSQVDLHHNVAARIAANATGLGNPRSACFHLLDSSQVPAEHLTCSNPGVGGKGVGHGVLLEGDEAGAVQVSNSIITSATGFGLHNETASELYLRARYTAFHDNAQGNVNNAQLKEGCIEGEDPRFANPSSAVVSLLPNSPCIDVGDPASDYADEPDPNGCRVNVGAYGNTADATSAADADHCE